MNLGQTASPWGRGLDPAAALNEKRQSGSQKTGCYNDNEPGAAGRWTARLPRAASVYDVRELGTPSGEINSSIIPMSGHNPVVTDAWA